MWFLVLALGLIGSSACYDCVCPCQPCPPTSTSTTPPTSTTTLSPAVVQCIRDCPVTAEYNPVCGSNNQTYSNPGRLMCAQFCGVDVTEKRTGPCSILIPN